MNNMQEFTSLKELVTCSLYITYATVNEDGSPHNSPMFYIPDSKLDKIYIGTHPDSLHANNLARTGKAFGVLFGKIPAGGRGVYFKIENFYEVTKEELPEALKVHNEARAKISKDAITIDYYQEPNPQRMYGGDIIELSMNDTVRNSQGRLEKDIRRIVELDELLS